MITAEIVFAQLDSLGVLPQINALEFPHVVPPIITAEVVLPSTLELHGVILSMDVTIFPFCVLPLEPMTVPPDNASAQLVKLGVPPPINASLFPAVALLLMDAAVVQLSMLELLGVH
jgi:hypothetical protein